MKSPEKGRMNRLQRIASGLSKWCAYRYLSEVILALIHGGKLSEQMRAGRNIALLGLFCPIFWFALFLGADKSTLALHAAHSGIVFLIGVGIMLVGLIKPK
ncbi:hypothetical protein QEH59_14920 [Coraliomargarita sp. SDUM461004]|uniref:Uncharacterized protein n=1 Tax=Thalassobacterium sedimentorum TaxID=3041258 RepID=A0ABU1ALP5_9BACT|nr:hypothetical protein [Coraliomargarita sp. SDUM461004]MDQ8195725.1 hypothetical protein [Coraliomargarita sp. SDUM461004]